MMYIYRNVYPNAKQSVAIYKNTYEFNQRLKHATITYIGAFMMIIQNQSVIFDIGKFYNIMHKSGDLSISNQ
jgi:hypothetical protein